MPRPVRHKFVGSRPVPVPRAARLVGDSVDCGVDPNVDQLDRPVGDELADDGDGARKDAGGDEDAVVRSPLDDFGQVVEPRGEGIDDRQQVDRQEVVGGRLAVWASFGTEDAADLIEDGT